MQMKKMSIKLKPAHFRNSALVGKLSSYVTDKKSHGHHIIFTTQLNYISL